MEMLAGTSGYSYKEWLGHFYPEKLPSGEMLRYYARRLPTVEINNTFYRMPAASVLAGWSEQVPDRFAFTLKAPRSITHLKRLSDVETRVAEFLKRAGALNEKLGAVLFQLPPFLKKDLSRLRDFLGLLPPGLDVAVEFRHASWHDDEVYATLRDHAALLCVSDRDKDDVSPVSTIATSDRAYLRLRRANYDDDALKVWIERLASRDLTRAYVYFKHEVEGLAARMAGRFDELWRSRPAETL